MHKRSNAQIVNVISQIFSWIYPACPCASQNGQIELSPKSKLAKKNIFSFFQLQNSFQQPWEVELSLARFFVFHFYFPTMCTLSVYLSLLVYQRPTQEQVSTKGSWSVIFRFLPGVVRAKILTIFHLYFGRNDDFINSF